MNGDAAQNSSMRFLVVQLRVMDDMYRVDARSALHFHASIGFILTKTTVGLKGNLSNEFGFS